MPLAVVKTYSKANKMRLILGERNQVGKNRKKNTNSLQRYILTRISLSEIFQDILVAITFLWPQFNKRGLVQIVAASLIQSHEQVLFAFLQIGTLARSTFLELDVLFNLQILVALLNNLHNLDHVVEHAAVFIDQQNFSFYNCQ